MTKHYKLKKDLPTFKAGDEFYLNNEGDLVSLKERVVAYSVKTLDKFPNILTNWFESANTGFYLDEEGCIIEYDCNEDPYNLNYRKNIGNDFKTIEEARKYKDRLISLQTIKNDTKGFVPDWEDGNQAKRYGYYDHNNGCLEWNDSFVYQIQGAVYFGTKESIEKSFKKHRKEWLIVLGVEDENITR